ncbi:MAG: hypothetical protein AUG75_15875 [Cyanobacteria bacterium 13_1_20CM_4_61_6]|nr:MAG: hypothetical protein AUG75_15875 [Cyanobacteria bacterium 13_1_20CM_4_61_6]
MRRAFWEISIIIQHFFQYIAENMNPFIGSTLPHAKLKGKNFLKWIRLYIVQDEKKLVFKGHKSFFRFSPTILTLTTFSIHIRLLHICLPSFVKTREQLLKFFLGQTRHCSQKFWTFFHLIIGKHQFSLREEDKRAIP